MLNMLKNEWPVPFISDSLSVGPISIHGDGIFPGAQPTQLQVILGLIFRSHPSKLSATTLDTISCLYDADKYNLLPSYNLF